MARQNQVELPTTAQLEALGRAMMQARVCLYDAKGLLPTIEPFVSDPAVLVQVKVLAATVDRALALFEFEEGE